MKPSLHDYLLTGYAVDGTGRTIALHAERRHAGSAATVDVVFSGVVAYQT